MKAQCRQCDKLLGYHESTSSMKHHLKKVTLWVLKWGC